MLTFENPIVQNLINLADKYVTKVNESNYIDWQVQSFEDAAKEAGYVKLGSGFFSQAWSHPEINKYAVKLGFKKEDSGAAYAAFCRDNQGVAGIPVIHGLDRFRSCYVVLMDKLIAYDKLERIFDTKQRYFEATDRKLEKPSFIKQFEKVRDILRYSDTSDVDSVPVYRTAYRILSFFKGIAQFDLHKGNVMVDKFGQLVITDPVSFVKTCKKEHHELKRNSQVHMRRGLQIDSRLHHKVIRCSLPSLKQLQWANPFDDAILAKSFKHIFCDEVQALEWNECRKPKIEKGATNARKPAFLVARDARQGIKRNR